MKNNISIISCITIFVLSLSFGLGNFVDSYAAPQPKLLFGMGTESIDAINTPLVKESPTKMLTSWYNGPNDLNWMDDSWHTNFIADSYGKGYTHHIITYSNDAEVNFNSSKGPACGRQYPVSAQYVTDVEKLASLYKGSGPLYITMMTEFQGYTCNDNQWQGNENYFNALKATYLETMQRVRQANPNAKVSLGWGGWQTRFDNASTGAGRSLFPYFDDVMKQSQFQSFQAMQSDTNVQDIKEMTKLLGKYGPVMLAHFKPDNSSQSTFENDIRTILTDGYLQEVTGNGLFAMSFMDKNNMSNSPSIFSFIKDAVHTFGANAAPGVGQSSPVTPTPVVTGAPTAVPTAQPTIAATPSPTVTATNTPTITPTSTASPTSSPTSSATVAPTNTATPTAQGYTGEYFTNRNLTGNPAVVRDDTEINFAWSQGVPVAGIPQDKFSVRWTKQAQFDAGTYTFTTLSDDGIRLYVDNELLIDQWNDHGPTTYAAQKVMTAGMHMIRFEYYENTVGAVAKMSYQKTGTASVTAAPFVTPSPTAGPTLAPVTIPVGSQQTKIRVFAAGTPSEGVYPTLHLVLNGGRVATFENIKGNPTARSFQEFGYTAPSQVNGSIRLEFSNNGAANGEDRNVYVDKIIVGNTTYETEDPSVYSVGSWNQSAGCGGGNKRSEKLHCNGYFQYR